MRSTFKVLFYVKKGSAKPNGNLPLMCRLTVDGEIKQFSCKMDVPPRLWDVKNSRASGKSVEAQRINRAVDKIRVDVNRRYQELMQTDGYVTAAKLKDTPSAPQACRTKASSRSAAAPRRPWFTWQAERV